jgi:hypothetical protein
MDIKNKGIYESHLSQIIYSFETLLREALYPYAGQIKGAWEASTIKDKVVEKYTRAYALRSLYKESEKTIDDSKEYKDGLEELSRLLCEEVDKEIELYFDEHIEGSFFIPSMISYRDKVFVLLAQ